MKKIGNRIKQARRSAGLSQEKLAEAIDVSRTAVARWENDEIVPTLNNMIGISRTLKVSIDYLAGENNSRICNLSPEAYSALEIFVMETRKSNP